jgi:type II secretory pathway pseudopilin PulG
MFRRLKNPLAFTMVELILVMALMAILAATVIPIINNNSMQTKDSARDTYYSNIKKQAKLLQTTYNDAKKAGQTPRLAGYDLSTARGMQECMRAANNNADVYEIEFTTVNEKPDPNSYNNIDTIVICVQFFAKGSTEPIINSNGVPCSPEQAAKGEIAYSCRIMKVYYIKVDEKTHTIYKQGGLV